MPELITHPVRPKFSGISHSGRPDFSLIDTQGGQTIITHAPLETEWTPESLATGAGIVVFGTPVGCPCPEDDDYDEDTYAVATTDPTYYFFSWSRNNNTQWLVRRIHKITKAKTVATGDGPQPLTLAQFQAIDGSEFS